MKFTIGTDPEFMLMKGGKYVSAIPHMVGTKKKPQTLPSGGTLQRDNVAVEFATPPANSEDDFVEKVQTSIRETRALIPDGSLLRAVPSAHFDKRELKHPEALEIGCEPDFNAWTGLQNEPPISDFRAGTLRSCGAHIHAGHRILEDVFAKQEMVQIMDYCVGIPSVILDYDMSALERRKLYGKSGAYRPTNYGVEYRTLSNFWLKSPSLVRLIYNLTHDSLKNLSENKYLNLIEAFTPIKMRGAIDNGLVTVAIYCMDKIGEFLSERSLMLFTRCMDNITKFDMEKEWV